MARSKGASRKRADVPTEVTAALLTRLRPAATAADDSKEERGRVLIVGGSREVPGAMRLAAR